mmetsp:Transcript_64090/g.139483  ORF Transcript_64090/g.139483 Transcript_64090/m.139483 type:complete len:84 (-) Transcript_64090:3-254(-)
MGLLMGYTLIDGTSFAEVVFGIVSMILGFIIFTALLLPYMFGVIQRIQAPRTEKKQKLSKLERFLRRRHVSVELTRSVRRRLS